MVGDRHSRACRTLRRAARRGFIASLALLAPLAALACDCFSPEARMRTAQETLDKAHVAVYGRVVDIGSTGVAKIRVLESFKGPAVGSLLELRAGGAGCVAPQALQPGEEALVLSFGDSVSTCDRHPRDHYLVEMLRALGSNGR